MRVLFLGGTGPVGSASLPYLLAAGHTVAVAHTGAHEPDEARDVAHLHGTRSELLAPAGPVERWHPEILIDTFAGGANAEKAEEMLAAAERAQVVGIVAISSMDVYRHCADAGVDDNEPSELAHDPLPLTEVHPRRGRPSPRAGADFDNVAMEDALAGGRVTVLRPGAIYAPCDHPFVLREWYLVGKVAARQRRLPLPDGGTQIFNRVAVERVGRAVAAAVDTPFDTFTAYNVADPVDFTFGGLARLVAERLDWEWAPEPVSWAEGDHPWNVRHPVIADTTRLREGLGVTEPDPLQATLAQIDWLWEHRGTFAGREL